jgi:hypothetical protein
MPVFGPRVERYAGSVEVSRVKKRITKDESLKPRP